MPVHVEKHKPKVVKHTGKSTTNSMPTIMHKDPKKIKQVPLITEKFNSQSKFG